MAKICTIAYVPDDLAQDWLQHLRDFDAKHPKCHFEVVAEADLSTDRIIKMLKDLTPPFPSVKAHKKQ